ncbi:MAG: hypothetical protein JNL96_26460 [Planctomycetaceae bacterium]|nr:hypothetical protein [Planctomycetaceae bacterium]
MSLTAVFMAAAISLGCSGESKPSGAGSPGPSLDSRSAEERAAAAKEAEEKYGS